MLVNSNFMYIALLVCILGMAILAIFYLRRRFLTPWRYFAWGFFAILVPLIGPFLVIAIRPGVRKLDKHDKAELTIEQREN